MEFMKIDKLTYNFTLSDDGELVPVLGKALLKRGISVEYLIRGWKDQKKGMWYW
jgi:hypothetical protein